MRDVDPCAEVRSRELPSLHAARLGRRPSLLLLLGALLACGRDAEEETPERVVRQFIDRMQRVHGDVGRARAAFELLSESARSNLRERAQRASAAAGRIVHPEEMLVPSRFHLAFQPRSWATQRGSNWAIVTAEGEGPSERREVRLVREENAWRVLLELPKLPELRRRSGSTP